ncbi:TetR family transcriptional regulator [Microlunatus endophyticus]|uniref:TetR family transcriptional regulator n=1 Tax=Microlunatus endophyticus TaxID=1716077 RepID=A0A917W477_9ACTN|nr:TetR/AcrR family transcriptional regulator [Microlunatus endophyticus]GGL61707.1 TetR family transcriptional regulator [Microlunatus endophyticus]
MPDAARYPKRSAHAARTREAIIAAAAELFSAQGYTGTTMKAIAITAGVSVESVYLAGSKSSLLATAMTVAFTGREGDRPLAEDPAYAAVFALPDPNLALNRYVELVSASIARSVGLWRTARAAADVEPEIRRLFDEVLARRRSDLELAGPWLVAHRLITPAEADDVVASLSVLVSHEVYEHLVVQFGWPVTKYSAWLRSAIDRLILNSADRPAESSPTEQGRP